MNRLTPLHLEHLDYTLKRLSNALSSARQREQPPYDMQPLIHCLDILDKGVRRTALFMNKEWPEPKMAEAQAALETLGPQSAEKAPVMDASGYEAELEKEAAKGFFSSLPWEGEGAARPDDSSISPRLNPEKPSIMGSATTTQSKATAAQYFSSLPWQHESQALGTQSGKHHLEQESTDIPRAEAELGKEAAKGFFSSLPWEGEGAARADDSSVSTASNTEPAQGTAAEYFSSLPWQHEEQAQCNKKRSPLHIQSGASALRGKQSVSTAAPNPILAATHSAIETIRSASLDNHADNLPQEDEHGLDQTDEKQTNIGQKQNEHSSSNDKPAKAPQARDNL